MAKKPVKTILIFEPQSGGHRANFIKWLGVASPECAGYRFVFFTSDDAAGAGLARLGWWEKQKKIYQLFCEACQIHQPDHALILELTHLELSLLLFGSPVPLSAILFVQYPELSNGWRKVSKHWKTRLLLHRAPVKNFFLLNGEKSCRYLTDHFAGETRFIPIPDPAPETPSEPDFNLRKHFNISPERKTFLFFGAISRRKGADVLLEALREVDSDFESQSAFIFCGEPELAYRDSFLKAVAEVQGIEIYVEDHFVSDERMMALFAQCDVVLMPYTRPEYSSGILALAAKAGKPVIGPRGGLLGRLIEENGLGATTTVTPAALADALSHSISVDEEKQREFSSRSRIENFSKIILNAICNES